MIYFVIMLILLLLVVGMITVGDVAVFFHAVVTAIVGLLEAFVNLIT